MATRPSPTNDAPTSHPTHQRHTSFETTQGHSCVATTECDTIREERTTTDISSSLQPNSLQPSFGPLVVPASSAVPPSTGLRSSNPLTLLPSPLTPANTIPLDPEAIRDSLLRELEAAKEENRIFYIESARKMIQMQEKIDSLTRENVKLIRSLTPQALNW